VTTTATTTPSPGTKTAGANNPRVATTTKSGGMTGLNVLLGIIIVVLLGVIGTLLVIVRRLQRARAKMPGSSRP
jgi:hypothetical protein